MNHSPGLTHTTAGSEPLLSIVVPFYNVEDYIGECLESLHRQLLPDVEVILVDDGSMDGSLAVAEQYVATDPRFRIIRQENQGLGPARNTGTRAASGKYLTFVDSDDVVAPRAYTAMVSSLERTGSAFAAGNAYRFNATKGVYQSWTHRRPFRKTKLRTSLDRFVPLVQDRMIWNKVFRRTFWDANGYEFPAIRYEDYPVTLRAYLEADSVDILSTHVYLWRDRESGDSITQQAANADNARERYVSARMVLDILAHHDASPAVRRAVEAYFIHIDLVSLAQAMVSVPEADRVELEAMTLDLAKILDPSSDGDVTRLARLIHRRLLAGDLPVVRDLAGWRLTGDTGTLARALLRKPKPLVLPVAFGAVLNRNLIQNPIRPRRLRSELQRATWEGPVLRLRIETRLRADLARRATPSASFRTNKGRRMPVRVVSTEPTPSGVVLELELDTRDAHSLPVTWRRARLQLQLRIGALRWVGPVRFTPDVLPGVHQLSDGTWWQLRGIGLHVGLGHLFTPVVVERVQGVGSTFVLHPSLSAVGQTIYVHRPAPTPDVPIQFGVGPATVEATALVLDDPSDDPVTKAAERRVVAAAPPKFPPLRLPDDLHDDDVAPDSAYEHVYLVGDGAKIRIGDTEVAMERGWRGDLVVRHSPAVPDPDTAS